MKKLKIILPAIALLVVLSMSLTIGVFAAMQTSLSVTSTVTFVSPDTDVIVDCYIGTDISGQPDHTYSKEKKEPWVIDVSKLSFKTTIGSADVADETLTFVITNNSKLPAYTYFTKTGEEEIIYKDSLDGNAKDGEGEDAPPINKDIISVSLDKQKKIAGKVTDDVEAEKQISTISFKLNRNLKVQDTATFNYTLVASKKSANLFTFESEEDFTNNPTISMENKTITNIANGTNGVFTYNTQKLGVGNFVVSGETTGRSLRFLVKAYNENDEALTSDTLSIEGGTYNNQYGGWYFPNNAETPITIVEEVAYWHLGFVFMGEEDESVTYSNITVLQQ